ncbi:E3 ubiquitin-protein ligase TRAF7-like isoform X2 [Oscarella lobularis]
MHKVGSIVTSTHANDTILVPVIKVDKTTGRCSFFPRVIDFSPLRLVLLIFVIVLHLLQRLFGLCRFPFDAIRQISLVNGARLEFAVDVVVMKLVRRRRAFSPRVHEIQATRHRKLGHFERLTRAGSSIMEEEVPTKFVDPPSQSLACPICRQIFTEPVISVQCGHTFCRRCVVSSSRCPVDEIAHKPVDLVVNRAIQSQIEELAIYCRYGLKRSESDSNFVVDDEGCCETVRFGRRDEHESVCPHAFVPCPLGGVALCGFIRRRDIDEHVAQCRRVRCPYSTSGCDFRGGSDEIENHKAICGFRGIAFIHASQSSEISQLRKVNEELRRNMQLLVEQMTVLESSVSEIHAKMEHYENLIGSLREEVLRRQLKEIDNQTQIIAVTNHRSPIISLRQQHKRSSSLTSALPSHFHVSDAVTTHSSGNIAQPTPPTLKIESWTMPFTFKCIGTFRGHNGGVFRLAANKGRLYSGSRDGMVKVWDVGDLKRGCIETLKFHRDTVQALVIGNGRVYSAGADTNIAVWGEDSLEIKKTIEKAHKNIVSSLAVVGKYLFSASLAEIKVWNALTLDHLRTLEGLNHWVRALAVDEQNEKVYSGAHNTIHTWLAHGDFSLCGKLDLSQGSIYSLVVTRQYLIAGTYNQNIHIYDINKQQHVKALFGHISSVTDLAVSLSGRFLFSSSLDATVQVWNLENMLPIQVLKRHEAGVNSVTIHEDHLLSASEDHEIKIFKYFKM